MNFLVEDLGRLGYDQALAKQTETLEAVIAKAQPSTLLTVEHDPVLTLGASFHEENLLLSPEDYTTRGIEIRPIDRGGDVTYHGPGQLVAYPIFDIQIVGKDLHRWLRTIEESVILGLAQMGLEGRRFAPHTGVWIGDRKVCAIGIKVRRWVSFHGLALNVDLDLKPFDLIVPCGIEEYGVTSISAELGRSVSMDDAKSALIAGFRTVLSSIP